MQLGFFDRRSGTGCAPAFRRAVRIPRSIALMIQQAQASPSRIIAIGTHWNILVQALAAT